LSKIDTLRLPIADLQQPLILTGSDCGTRYNVSDVFA